MNDTVREKIILAIRTRLATLAWVGTVFGVGNGMDEVVNAVEDEEASVLVLFGDDERLQVTNTVERLRFEVEVQIVFKPATGVLPEVAAARHCADVYALYTSSETAGTWDGWAIDSLVEMPVGGVESIGSGLFVTSHSLSVDYGFVTGNPASAA